MTTVVSVRGRDRDRLLADPLFCYVGREVFRGGNRIWKGSPWGNPFRVGMRRPRAVEVLGCDIDRSPRAETLAADLAVCFYRAWLSRELRDPEKAGALRSLVGRRLGCWCATWRPGEVIATPCHAIVLAQHADALEPL